MKSSILQLHDVKTLQKSCPLCTDVHMPNAKCSFQSLRSRITKLLEANSLIPQILTAQKEATVIAQYFQQMLKKSDQAHTILLEVLAEYDYTGEEIKNKYLERLDEWAKGNLSQDTSVQPDLFSPKNSTQNENDAKLSTTTESGEHSQLDS